METVLIFYLCVTGLIALVMIVYVAALRIKHYKRKNKDTKLLAAMCDNPAICSAVETLIIRRYNHRCNYIGFQLVDKVFGMAGIIYSLMGFLTIVEECSQFTEFIINFTAIICVIIALYLTPRNRIAEYDRSAKKLDNRVQRAFSMIAEAEKASPEGKSILFEIDEYVAEAIEESEKEIISDEQ